MIERRFRNHPGQLRVRAADAPLFARPKIQLPIQPGIRNPRNGRSAISNQIPVLIRALRARKTTPQTNNRNRLQRT